MLSKYIDVVAYSAVIVTGRVESKLSFVDAESTRMSVSVESSTDRVDAVLIECCQSTLLARPVSGVRQRTLETGRQAGMLRVPRGLHASHQVITRLPTDTGPRAALGVSENLSYGSFVDRP